MIRIPLPLPRPENASLLVIDVQERLVAAMDATATPGFLRNHLILVELFTVFGGAVIITEQYPKGLGPTVSAISDALPPGVLRVEKTAFSVFRESGAAELQLRPDVIVTGMETHVCVLQTAFDALARGHRVFVPRDAVLSRTAANRDNGLELLAAAGAFVINTETLVFAALEKAGSEHFKRFSALVR